MWSDITVSKSARSIETSNVTKRSYEIHAAYANELLSCSCSWQLSMKFYYWIFKWSLTI